MSRADKYLIVIAGPTAVGKTDLSIRLARHFSADILSADSRQFYRETNIGTAKPSEQELSEAKHHFINNLSIQDNYTAGMYETDALNLLETLFQKNNVAIMTGGSGLFIKAVCEGLDDIPAALPGVRDSLNHLFQTEGLDPLLAELKEKDPDYFEKVDRDNPVRIIRALEVSRSTGRPFSSYRKTGKKDRPFTIIKIGLNRSREELYERIDRRMDHMLSGGLVEEAKALYSCKECNALQTVGYSELFDWMDGVYDFEEAVRLLKRNSRHYAKRQLTWFNRDAEIKWYHPDDAGEIVAYIESRIK